MSYSLSKQYTRELAVGERLAREAGQLALGYRRSGEFDVEMKAGNEPVTEADKRASALIEAGLAGAFPDDVIISEENVDDLRRLHAERVWYVDPIDGTKDFIRGHDGFAVMIGLAERHRPVVGVVYQPVHDRLFLAAEAGAWLIVPDEAPRKLQVSAVHDPGDIRLVASKSHRTTTIDRVKSALGIQNELNVSSVGLKLALIALAERDLYVNPSSHCKTWDTCAPEAILCAAGGALTDVHGDPLRYDREDIRRRTGLVASNGLLHPPVIERLQTVFPRQRSSAV